MEYDVVIIGGGVAGLTAGIYTGRANKKVLIIESGLIGGVATGLVDIQNYPGIEHANGLDMVLTMQNQCVNFGVEFVYNDIKHIDFDKNSIEFIDNTVVSYKTLIVASGSKNVKITAKNSQKFEHRGLSYCAVCDGNLFKDKKIVVITNNLSASADINYLLGLTKNITVLDLNKGYKNDILNVISNVTILEVLGDTKVTGIKYKTSENEYNINCDGIFVDLGRKTDLSLYENVLEIKDNQILSDADMHTNVDNVWVAGDVRFKSLKQIITACSDGAIAGSSAIKYLVKNKK